MKEKLGGISRVLRFMRPYAPQYTLGILCYGGQSFLLGIVNSLFLSWLTAGMLARDAGMIWRYSALYCALTIGVMAGIGYGVYLFVRGREICGKGLKFSLFRAFVTASVEGRAHTGEGVAAINTEADLALELTGNPMSQFIGSIICIVGPGVVIFAVDVRLGLLALGIGLVALLLQSRFSGPLERVAKARLDANAASVRAMTTLLSGAANVRLFNLQDKMLADFERGSGAMLRADFKGAWIASLRSLFTTLQGWLSLAGVFGVGGYLVATGQLGLPALMMVPSLCVTLAGGMSGIGAAWAGIQGPIAAANRVGAVLDAGEASEEIARRKGEQAVPWDGGTVLAADRLTFRYPAADRDALADVSLRVGEREMVALVGASGSGKSTLLRALAGFYERNDLDIRLGNLSLRDTPAKAWRRHFAYVDQNCTLFAMSAADNIALGREGAARGDIERAAAQARAEDFILSLPNGYDTPCGERGAALSGGQKQRIAIARALVRRAPVLAFDEATSALDAESERQVMETIERLRGDHTILIATHNLASIQSADRIVVMKDGRIAQQGTHEALLKEGGEYVRLLKGMG